VEADESSPDVRAIRAIIDSQFRSLSWSSRRPADWAKFAADFFADASLYPSARPAKRQTVAGFVERMQGLARTSLRSFDERVLGVEIRVFGNVAMAMAACGIQENEAKASRGVEALLLIKDEGRWKIVAQAWDTEGDGKTIPARLLSGA
jgi:ketosteroid isomerase-like protein